jgi:hypothetical protein
VKNTGDCKISYSVVATIDVLRLQKAVAKTSMCVIATLSHVRDCRKTVAKKHVSAIAKKQVKCDYKKPVQKSSMP